MELPNWYSDPSTPCVVIGNGPSLKGVDLNRFADFDTFGMNVAFRHWAQIDWYPDYYSCLDEVVGLHHMTSIRDLITNRHTNKIRKFLLRDNLVQALGELGTDPCVVNFDQLRVNQALFNPLPITTGSHTCAWAAALGYTKIAIVGVDCNYVERVSGSTLRKDGALEIADDTAENPNYYFDGYQAPGDLYNVPNPSADLHLNSWRSVACAVDGTPAKVVNANPVSLVDCYPIVSVDAVVQMFSTSPLENVEPVGNPVRPNATQGETDSEVSGDDVSTTVPKVSEQSNGLPHKLALWLERHSPPLLALARFLNWGRRRAVAEPVQSVTALLVLFLLIYLLLKSESAVVGAIALVVMVGYLAIKVLTYLEAYAARLNSASVAAQIKQIEWHRRSTNRHLQHQKEMLQMMELPPAKKYPHDS